MRPVVIAVAASLFLSLPTAVAFAQQTAPSPETLQLAQKLVEISGSNKEQTLAAIKAPLTTMMGQMLAQMGVSDPVKAQALVDEAVMPILNDQYPQLVAISAKSFADVLSNDDMKAAIAFYSTPAGQDMVRLQPQLSKSRLEAITQWMTSVQPEMMTKVSATIKAHHWDKPATSGN